MSHDRHPTSERTPIDLGLDLLLVHQHIVTELVGLGLASVIMVLVGSLGIGLVRLTARLAAPLRYYRRQRILRVHHKRAVCVSRSLYSHSDKGDYDGI